VPRTCDWLGPRAYAEAMSAQPVHAHGPIPRDPKAIRAALAEEFLDQFDAEYASALEQAKALSVVELNNVLDQWWMFANLNINPGAHLETVERFLAGESVPVAPITLEWLRSGR
jgi:hypothetical protein